MPDRPRVISALAREARALSPRDAWNELRRGFSENDLLTFASAIAFRVAMALIPLLLLAFALLGLFGFEEVWRSDVAPDVKKRTSTEAFTVINDAVLQVLGGKQFFWATLGAVIAVWEVSSGMRAVMSVLNRIYGTGDERPWGRRLTVSIWLSALVTVMLLAAAATSQVIPEFVGGSLVEALLWIVTAGILMAVIAVVVRFAPARDRPIRWVSFGAVLVTAGWIGATLLYGLYVTSIASYGSVFGSLATLFITLGYLYIVSIVFLTGLQLDALIRRVTERGG